MDDTTTIRPPYRWAFVTFGVILALYVLTLGPTTAFWDTSEYIAAAKILGIPHPPGNPLFTLMAHVWGLIPWAADYAARINLFAAVTSAAGAAFWFLVAERWLQNILPARLPRLASAFAGVFVSATAWSVWNQSTVNEKVYTVSLLSIALIVWTMVRWADLPNSPRRNGLLIFAAYISALTSTNHMMGVLAIPIIAIYVLWTEPKLALKPWVMLMAWVLLLGVSGILGDSLAVVHAMMFGSGEFTGNFANASQFLTLSAPVEGASAINEITRIGGLLGIVGLFGWGVMKERKNPLLYVGVLAVVMGLTLNYIYLPLRAVQHPAINEGEPIGFFSQKLMDLLNRIQYGKPPTSQRMSAMGAQFAMYWQYWGWQWARDIRGLSSIATGLFTAFTLGGLLALFKRDKRAGVSAAALLFTLTLLLIYYLNFRYGFSYHRDDASISNDMREVRERDYFFLASFAFVGVLIAAGFAAAIRAIGEWLGDRTTDQNRWLFGMPVLLLALIPLLGNRITAPRSKETLARDFAIDMLESVEPYGILITAGDNDTFPLWFAQEVLKIRPDVTLANLSLMNTEWHLKQIARRVTPTFDPSTADPYWRPQTDTTDHLLGGGKVPSMLQKPTNSVLQLTPDQIDSLGELVQAPADGSQVDSLKMTFGAKVLSRSDVAAALLIHANLGHRKIYFSWSDGTYPDDMLGLHDYLLSEGLVRELRPAPIKEGGSIRNVGQGFGFMDVARTRDLLFGVYHSKTAAAPRPAGWTDEPSASILSLYALVYQNFAPVLREAGDSVTAKKAEDIAMGVCRNLPLGWCRQ